MSIRLRDIYDVEGAIERAAQTVFDAAGITCFTSQSDPTLQRERPRVEILVKRGAGLGRWLEIDIADGSGVQQRQQAWRIGFGIQILTDANIEIHTAYRAQVFALIYSLAGRINGTSLLYHKLMPWISDEGASPVLRSQDGFYRTELILSSSVAVQADAWAQVDPALT